MLLFDKFYPVNLVELYKFFLDMAVKCSLSKGKWCTDKISTDKISTDKISTDKISTRQNIYGQNIVKTKISTGTEYLQWRSSRPYPGCTWTDNYLRLQLTPFLGREPGASLKIVYIISKIADFLEIFCKLCIYIYFFHFVISKKVI